MSRGYEFHGWGERQMKPKDWNILSTIWIKLGYSYLPLPFFKVVMANIRMCSEKNMEALGLRDITDER